MAAGAINKRRLQQWQLLSTDQLTPVQVITLFLHVNSILKSVGCDINSHLRQSSLLTIPNHCQQLTLVEIDWDQPGEILSPGCPHHPCLSIPGTRRLPVLSPIKKYGWWNKNGCCHLYCGSGHFHNIKIIVNGSNMTPFHWN